MRALRIIFAFCLLPVLRLGAVYAPIPEVEQGKALTVYLSTGVFYDSNIFGGSVNEVSSYVYQLNPNIAFNASIDGRTLASAAYRLSYDYMPDRPGKKSLDSHEFMARLAHTFTPQMELDFSDTYQIAKNPESLLPGLATVVNTDQSFSRNQFDSRFAMSLTKRTGLTFKGRHTRYAFADDVLADSLDRSELLVGVTASQTVLPLLQTMLEYRHLDIRYDTEGRTKNKRSDFFLLGLDRALNARFSVSGRLGVEQRRRASERSDTLPYAELGLKLDYGQGSYVSVGYGYSVEETSNTELYTDMSVNRCFLNLQQMLTPKFALTGSLTWEPSRLHGRQGVRPDQSETNTQLGGAFVYRPTRRWSVSLTVDYDRISSDDRDRALKRTRAGLSTKYVF
ncbi:MAG: hypothetical protein QM715_01725 [Nibricoccus sp.]